MNGVRCNLNAVRIELPTFYERSTCVPGIIAVVRYISLRAERSWVGDPARSRGARSLVLVRIRGRLAGVFRVLTACKSRGEKQRDRRVRRKGRGIWCIISLWMRDSSSRWCAWLQILRSPIRQTANASDITGINLPGSNTESLTTILLQAVRRKIPFSHSASSSRFPSVSAPSRARQSSAIGARIRAEKRGIFFSNKSYVYTYIYISRRSYFMSGDPPRVSYLQHGVDFIFSAVLAPCEYLSRDIYDEF